MKEKDKSVRWIGSEDTPSSLRSNWSKYNKFNWVTWFWRHEERKPKGSVFIGNCYVGQLCYCPKESLFWGVYKGKEQEKNRDEWIAVISLLKAYRKDHRDLELWSDEPGSKNRILKKIEEIKISD